MANPPPRLTLPQTQIESARGMLMAAAKNYGDTPLGLSLWRLSIELTRLREPGAVAFYEAKRMQAAMAGSIESCEDQERSS